MFCLQLWFGSSAPDGDRNFHKMARDPPHPQPFLFEIAKKKSGTAGTGEQSQEKSHKLEMPPLRQSDFSTAIATTQSFSRETGGNVTAPSLKRFPMR